MESIFAWNALEFLYQYIMDEMLGNFYKGEGCYVLELFKDCTLDE